MKKVLLISALIALFSFSASSALAQSYERIDFSYAAVPTSAVATVYTTPALYGKLISVVVSVESNMNFSLSTKSGYGMSLNAAKTVMASVTVTKTAGNHTNIADSVYLYGDIFDIGAGLNTDTAAVTGVSGYLLLKKD
jgi:hypothetical protein